MYTICSVEKLSESQNHNTRNQEDSTTEFAGFGNDIKINCIISVNRNRLRVVQLTDKHISHSGQRQEISDR